MNKCSYYIAKVFLSCFLITLMGLTSFPVLDNSI